MAARAPRLRAWTTTALPSTRPLLPQDPFQLLLQLLPGLLAHPSDARFADSGGPLTSSLDCTAHRRPAEVLRALLAALHPAVVSQAAAAATGGVRSAAEMAAALAASPPLASALESAVCSQLLPYLQRAALLVALLTGAPAPAPPALAGGSAAPAVAVRLQQLGLPPVLAALQSPAASSLALPPDAVAALPRASSELSVRAGEEQWAVAVLPPPPAPKLLQLPASYQVRPAGQAWQCSRQPLLLLLLLPLRGSCYQAESSSISCGTQGWYLSLGRATCSACGQVPSEPALCLRCGAVLWCGGERRDRPWCLCACSLRDAGGPCMTPTACLTLLLPPHAPVATAGDAWVAAGR